MSTLSVLFVSIASIGAVPQGELLDFSATWCGPCQRMSGVVSRLERQGYPVRKVDIDRNPGLARKLRISSIPAFVLVVNGKEVNRIVGMTTEHELKRLLAKIPQASTSGQAVAGNNRDGSQPPPRRSPDVGNRPSAPIAHSRGSRTRDVPLVKVSDGEKRRGFGFNLPFFGKRDNESKSREVQLESSEPPVIRAKLGQRDAASARAALQGTPLDCSTRVRVKDGGGVNFGSGTIVDSRPGRTIVLTCGHIFRDLSEDALIEVDVFLGNDVEKYVGKVVDYNFKADVGLIAIPTESPLPSAKVAPQDASISRGEPVVSIGCGGGERPSVERLRVTALNRYTGPDNIECTGVPVQGRSGGGLFNGQGEVVGVCIAADPKEQRGLYAGLEPIQSLLEGSKLEFVYNGEPERRDDKRNAADVARQFSQDASPKAVRDARDKLSAVATSSEPGEHDDPLDHRFDPRRLDMLPAALEQAGDAEVVCIIRPLDDPNAASRVVIINQASSKFISYLQGELAHQPRETMHSVKRCRTGRLSDDLDGVFGSSGPGLADEIRVGYDADARDGDKRWQPSKYGQTSSRAGISTSETQVSAADPAGASAASPQAASGGSVTGRTAQQALQAGAVARRYRRSPQSR